ncbi:MULTISPECIES: hypothetical protein [unclassified Pseudomonas]|uniref:hypothetical protein n=1 Tax=unclassified Pseudomonas TaxID=196821 RepID=UPI000BC3E9B2|nr:MULTISPECIES: hypothetical protein [unclassified Pseudomonas]PVZ20278.1 hypothetical protein F474_00874 [Pseudomonas sp. URIL14HWK12:I12]PVZ27344.1 hypothetical protein F470_00529 [Pseudomonas sp. URIL14HWK12:I10]PVZ38233.1 hypothetical protein F472_00874 [Pseudomonas sp. URIL14HWK12:I11]SNZ04162.1 hypothetical protein SAMN05660463_00530 [Pseudomonas sp. URIL14HWK12:I9]
MTQKQRLIYSLLIALVVLLTMMGLGWLQAHNQISEQVFRYMAIGIALLTVAANAVLRRRVKR